jgi:hypothetical protein
MKHKSIQDHIEQDIKQLSDPLINSQRKRHLESELDELNRYRMSHPNDDYDPTPLELFCNDNPNSPECKIYDL